MTAELVQTLAEHGISSAMTTDEALVYRLLDSVAADGGLTPDAKKEVRGSEEVHMRICNSMLAGRWIVSEDMQLRQSYLCGSDWLD